MPTKPWYPGHENPKVRMKTEMCMGDLTNRIKKRGEKPLTTGQYNSVYEAIETLIASDAKRIKDE